MTDGRRPRGGSRRIDGAEERVETERESDPALFPFCLRMSGVTDDEKSVQKSQPVQDNGDWRKRRGGRALQQPLTSLTSRTAPTATPSAKTGSGPERLSRPDAVRPGETGVRAMDGRRRRPGSLGPISLVSVCPALLCASGGVGRRDSVGDDTSEPHEALLHLESNLSESWGKTVEFPSGRRSNPAGPPVPPSLLRLVESLVCRLVVAATKYGGRLSL